MNREKKSHADWTNRHIIKQMNNEEKKDKTISFHSTNKESMAQERSDNGIFKRFETLSTFYCDVTYCKLLMSAGPAVTRSSLEQEV